MRVYCGQLAVSPKFSLPRNRKLSGNLLANLLLEFKPRERQPLIVESSAHWKFKGLWSRVDHQEEEIDRDRNRNIDREREREREWGKKIAI